MRNKRSFLFTCFILFVSATWCQPLKTKNVVIITFDGYRWHELFGGADSVFLFGKAYTTQDSAWRVNKYWAKDTLERRKKLMPFFWGNIAKYGQIYGNRKYENFVSVKNRYWFSYPGYNEMLTGYPDTLVNSNAHPHNLNENVLEYVNKQPGFKGKVGVFTSWDAFYRILNDKRSGLPVNSGFNDVKGDSLSNVQKTLNELQHWLPKMFGGGERHDGITYSFAKEYVKLNHPRLLQISFIETDALAHDGKYDFYLDAAHYNDAMIGDLWNFMQSDPFYKDQTTFIITGDHGRGYEDSWRHHYYSVPHSNEIFLAVLGPDTKPLGEIKEKGQLYQNQVAQTVASFLGLKFENGHPVGGPIKAVLPPDNGPIDASATKQTKALYSNLRKLSRDYTIFGHQDDLAYGVGWRAVAGKSDVKSVVNDYPGLYGWDLGRIELDSSRNIDGVPFSSIRKFIKEGYQRGGAITISWHLNNPLTGGSSWDTTNYTVKAVLPGGDKHALFVSWLDKAAAFLQSLKGNNGEQIPVLFRPFHELTGNWFWWCKNVCTPEEFKALWKFTINYLKNEKQLHNLLYVYNTAAFAGEADFLERYPGDEFADVLSLDMYQYNEENKSDQIATARYQLKTLCDVAAKKNKPAAFAEAGYEAIPDAKWWTQTVLPVIKDFPLSYILFWRNAGYMPSMKKMHYYVPYPGQVSVKDFQKFYTTPKILFEKRLKAKNIYQP